MVTVPVGKGGIQRTFMLQDTLLRQTSRVFSTNLNNEFFGEGQKGVLHFREDDVAAWKILVFWAFDRTMPENYFEANEGA